MITKAHCQHSESYLQLLFTCSKLKIKILEIGMNYVQNQQEKTPE